MRVAAFRFQGADYWARTAILVREATKGVDILVERLSVCGGGGERNVGVVAMLAMALTASTMSAPAP